MFDPKIIWNANFGVSISNISLKLDFRPILPLYAQIRAYGVTEDK